MSQFKPQRTTAVCVPLLQGQYETQKVLTRRFTVAEISLVVRIRLVQPQSAWNNKLEWDEL